MKLYAKEKQYTLYLGSMLDVLDTLPENSVDAIVTDPPYNISFMNKGWDNTGIAFKVETWKKCLRVLKPGGHLLAFNHSRTFHRMWVAIEDAGFEIRDTIMWIYGVGYPKSMNISKAIDKRGGNNIGWFGTWLREWREKNNIKQSDISKLFPSKTGGLTGCVANWELGLNIPTAEQYSKIVEHFNLPFKTIEEAERDVIGKYDTDMGGLGGKRLGNKGGDITTPATDQAKQWDGCGTALKPAHEPICLARKPIAESSIAQNVLKYGTGGINIDGCRVGNDKINVSGKDSFKEWQKEVKGFKSNEEGVNTTHFGRFPANLIHDGSDEVVELFPSEAGGGRDSGSASRFFYTAKASQTDRDEGLDGFEATNVNDGRDTPIDNAFQRGETLRKNTHPTVKPTDLMQYLVRLITPKGGTVLDPFMGSGSTGKAAMIENVLKGSNYHFIGVDITEEYLPIAQARIEQGIHFEEREVTTISTDDQGNKVKQVQTSIFDFLADD